MRTQELEEIRKSASKLTKPEIKKWLEWLKFNMAEGTHLESRIQVQKVLLSL
jgi:hypothetical protein